jgi:hypothetical protein
MIAQLAKPGRLDRIAMGLSGLCLIHCIATAALLALVASAGGLLGSPIIHEVGLMLAMVIGAIALGRGLLDHGFILPAVVGAVGLAVMAKAVQMPDNGMETVVTMVGVGLLALGHRLNCIAAE